MGLLSFFGDLDAVINEIESVEKELMVVKEETTVQEQHPIASQPTRASPPPSSGKNTMVGFEDHFCRIIDQLKGGYSGLQVLPIIGMGGIGKTTLAQNLFNCQRSVDHFEIRLWVTISQEYNEREILLGLLGNDRQQISENLAKLGQKLHKNLFGRRYLIVMDDVWDTKCWDDLKSFFPDNTNGSRIIVTTRLSDLVVPLGSQNPYLMNFLDEEKSWVLFREKAFGQNVCSPELEEIGKNIVRNCKGLPLTIVLIGALLANSNMTQKYWEFVEKNVNSLANLGDEERCLKILSLSYKHLPIRLKPCFLYMRVFPEDYEIHVSKLIKSWIAEGFIKPKGDKTLEQVAKEYLNDLINRNLILIDQLRIRSGKIKTCKIHDLLRDLCIREHHREHLKEHSFRIAKVQMAQIIKDRNMCFLCSDRDACTEINLPQVLVDAQKTSPISCFVCGVCNVFPQLYRLRFVKAMENIYLGVEAFLQHTKLRYLDATHGYIFAPTLLPLLWNLQTLVLHAMGKSTSEIWEMPQLRHIKTLVPFNLDDPLVTRTESNDSIILKNLHTIGVIQNFRCSEEMLKRIPNLEKLNIKYDTYFRRDDNWSCYQLHNLALLHKLRSLSLSCPNTKLDDIGFPHSLKKLCLGGCGASWEKMTIIGSLPNLDALELQSLAFEGQEWNPTEGEFLRLKSLVIGTWNHLVLWNAEKFHFPNLETLSLSHANSLERIPSAIGDIETMRSIRLIFCRESVVESAKEIIEEQRSFGNEDLQLHVY